MLEKPHLADDAIVSCLRARYGVVASHLEFLPIGNDSAARVYRADTANGRAYFLKLRRGQACEPGICVPRYLKDHGLEQVVAPLAAAAGDLWVSLEGFTLIVYPFIDGSPGMEAGLSESQWREFGNVLRRMHASALPPPLAALLPTETFTPRWSGLVTSLLEQTESARYPDHWQAELAVFLRGKSKEISALVARAEALGSALRRRPADLALCHADAHTGNVLVSGAGGVFVVDWDSTLLAPKERDLMFVVGGVVGGCPVGPADEAAFFEGYGATSVDWAALAYYRHEWVVQDIGDYGERVFLSTASGEETKRDAVEGLVSLFAPGNVVESAYEAERTLPVHQRHRGV